MENANQSSYPTAVPGVPQAHVGGLTKRERFAMGNWTETEIQQMASIVADEMNTDDTDFNDYVSVNDIHVRMKARVRLAGGLLKELEAKE